MKSLRILFIAVMLCFGQELIAQKIDRSIFKAIELNASADTAKALSIVRKVKTGGDSYNRLMASIYEIRWSGPDANKLISELRATSLYADVEKLHPRDTILGFYMSSMARHQAVNYQNFKLASDIYKNAISNYEKVYGKNSRRIESKYLKQAGYARKARDYQFALKNYLKVLDFSKEENRIKDRALAELYSNVARCYSGLQDDQKVIEYSDKSIPIYESVKDYHGIIKSQYRVGRALSFLKKPKESIERFKTSVELMKLHGYPDILGPGWPYYYISKINNDLRNSQEANDYALEGLSKLRPEDKNSWVESYLHYEAAYSFNGLRKPNDALEHGQKNFKLRKKLYKDSCRLKSDYIELGVFKRAAKDIRGSLREFEAAARLARNCKASDQELMTQYQKLGVEYWNQLRDGKKATEYWEKTLDLYKKTNQTDKKKLAILLTDLTKSYSQQSSFKKAIEVSLEARNIFESLGNKQDYHDANLDYSMALFDSGDLESAYVSLNSGLERTSTDVVSGETKGLYYIHLGEYFQKTRDFDNALTYFNNARKYLTLESKARVYSFIGSIYFALAQYDSALINYDRYERELTSVDALTADRLILTLINRGRVYENQQKFNVAVGQYLQAVKLFDSEENADKEWGLNAYAGLINCYEQLDEQDKIEEISLKLEPLLDGLKSKKDKHLVSVFNKLGSVYYSRDWQKSIDYFQLAFFHNTKDFTRFQSIDNPRASDFVDFKGFLKTARSKAGALVSMAVEADSVYEKHGNFAQFAAFIDNKVKGKSNNELYSKALETYMLCDTIINYTRELYTTEEAKQELSSQANHIFELAIFNAYNFYARTFDLKYKRQAYRFMAQNKARTLLESFDKTDVRSIKGVSRKILNEEKALNKKITQLGIQYGKTQEPSIKQEYDAARIELINLMQSIKVANPEYHKLRGSENIATVKEIKARLNDDMAYLEYYLMPDKGIIITTITKDTFDIEFTGSNFKTDRMIRGFRNALIAKDDTYTDQFGKTLYKALIDPISQYVNEKKKWTIVPDNLLGYMPFEALIDENEKYLLESREISYSYAGTLFTANKSGHKQINSILAFAPVFENEGTNRLVATKERAINDFNQRIEKSRNFMRGGIISSLPGTETEVEKIDLLYKDKGGLSDYFIHKDANEVKIKSMNLSKYKYLHFATHGIVDETNPQLSGLIMSQDPKSEEDCILYSGEVYELELNAELVTLSACETGLGKVVRGEGIVGLSRAFLYAGAENVQVSLWKVSDASTSELMVKFYEGVIEGKSNRAALRSAKLEILSKDEFSKPYYWAPFILIGQ